MIINSHFVYAFIKWSGLRLLQPVLVQQLEAGRPLRVLTTVYFGATDRRALDWLVERPRSGPARPLP